MPYNSRDELPESVKGVLPPHAEEIFMKAFNNAYDEYKDSDERRGKDSREEVAFKVAWSAVKKMYEKGDDNKWHLKK